MSISLKTIVSKLNDNTRKALEDAAGLCLSRTHYNVEIEHFLIKLLDQPDCDFARILKQFGVDKARLAAELGRSLDKLKTGNARTPGIQPVAVHDADRSLDRRLDGVRRGAGALRVRDPGAGLGRRAFAHRARRQQGTAEDRAGRAAQGAARDRGGFAARIPAERRCRSGRGAPGAAARGRRQDAATSISSPSISPRTPGTARSIRCWAAISKSGRSSTS